MNNYALLALICLLASCGSCGSSASRGKSSDAGTESPVDWTDRCHEYAKQCGGFGQLKECLNVCSGPRATHNEMCTFVYCGVETGQCDNDEEGDATIVACLKARGWPAR